MMTDVNTNGTEGAAVLKRVIFPLEYSSLNAEQKTAFDSAAAVQQTFMERRGLAAYGVRSETVGDVRVEYADRGVVSVFGTPVSPSALMLLCDAGLVDTWA